MRAVGAVSAGAGSHGVVRRDFVEVPQPTNVEYLCAGCWRVYVEEFLGEEWPEREHERVEATEG